jgi:TraK protein
MDPREGAGGLRPGPAPAGASTELGRAHGQLGVTRAVEARGEPILVRLALQRMTQISFGGDIQQVVTALAKPQVSMETAGPRLFLSALEPDLSGELFVTLTGGQTLTLVVVPARGPEWDLVVRVVSAVTEAAARAAETSGLTPLRLMRAMMLNAPLPGVSATPGDGRAVYDDGAVRLTRLATWTSPALEGVILAAENLRPLWITLPLDRLTFPGLLAVHAESESLAPPPTTPEQALAAQHRTRLYLVRTPDGR